MEIETWVQVTNDLVKHLAVIKKASSADFLFYSLYLLTMAVGVKFKVKSAYPSKIFPVFLTLLFCTLAYSLMLSEKESNYYIITTMFYVKAIFYYSKVNLKTAISCAIMALYLLIMSREAAYYEVHKQSFSDLLHDTYWMAVFILHCVICASFFSRNEYKRAYMGLCSRLRIS